MLIGLTGLIGAGKSTAARILESFGAVVLDADEIGREVVEASLPLRHRLAEAFGADVLTVDLDLDRKKVAERAFAGEESRRRLNEIVHPYLLHELDSRMRRLAKRCPVVVVDAALLTEWRLHQRMDYTIVIDAPEQVRLDRLAARGMAPSEARAIERLQPSPQDLRVCADFLVVNDGSTDRLAATLSDIWEMITRSKRGDLHEEPDTAP
ncbi:MAG TPA: dephospho-CoA kinase [candidate division Zixibacteria bacterium]|nr:dephospho-CoA kinase [candidate division Zixibacteria bacterium]HQL24678.1 dephospho-CoA kinase [candidate division Zixibacteria bacterium]